MVEFQVRQQACEGLLASLGLSEQYGEEQALLGALFYSRQGGQKRAEVPLGISGLGAGGFTRWGVMVGKNWGPR